MQAQSDAGVLLRERGIRPGDEGDDVAGQWPARRDHPPTRLTCRLGPLPRIVQSLRGTDPKLVTRLQVRLIEAGEPARRRIEEGHGVEVGLLIVGIDMAMQALAVTRIGHPALDDHRVLRASPVSGIRPDCQPAGSRSSPLSCAASSSRPRNSRKVTGPVLPNRSVVREENVSAARVGQIQLDHDTADLDLPRPRCGACGTPQAQRLHQIAVVGVVGEELRPLAQPGRSSRRRRGRRPAGPDRLVAPSASRRPPRRGSREPAPL